MNQLGNIFVRLGRLLIANRTTGSEVEREWKKKKVEKDYFCAGFFSLLSQWCSSTNLSHKTFLSLSLCSHTYAFSLIHKHTVFVTQSLPTYLPHPLSLTHTNSLPLLLAIFLYLSNSFTLTATLTRKKSFYSIHLSILSFSLLISLSHTFSHTLLPMRLLSLSHSNTFAPSF